MLQKMEVMKLEGQDQILSIGRLSESMSNEPSMAELRAAHTGSRPEGSN